MENYFNTNYKIPTTTSGKTSQLMQLFEEGLKDIFWAEKALIKEIPLWIQNATSVELIEVLMNHLEETYQQVDRLAVIYRSIDKKVEVKLCEAMEGLIAEVGKRIASCEPGAMKDARIVASTQKIIHYEIAAYSTLYQFAETLGLNEAAELLLVTLYEEKTTDKKLAEVSGAFIQTETTT
ncbi:DUF892 family protein [Flavobacterium orientale]|uniref:Ferritin-like metal-binding protein YciE n=1 Tax=Flavobacterium orientale TaxID=1756020 RepID=A0A916Y701_9FLAO|nr:DUF892 family protein [Flavobacterium orientale]GGD32571.1 hypothetical protein GCM10011343_23310 [Flavobacterium orientale]